MESFNTMEEEQVSKEIQITEMNKKEDATKTNLNFKSIHKCSLKVLHVV